MYLHWQIFTLAAHVDWNERVRALSLLELQLSPLLDIVDGAARNSTVQLQRVVAAMDRLVSMFEERLVDKHHKVWHVDLVWPGVQAVCESLMFLASIYCRWLW